MRLCLAVLATTLLVAPSAHADAFFDRALAAIDAATGLSPAGNDLCRDDGYCSAYLGTETGAPLLTYQGQRQITLMPTYKTDDATNRLLCRAMLVPFLSVTTTAGDQIIDRGFDLVRTRQRMRFDWEGINVSLKLTGDDKVECRYSRL